MHTTKTPTPGDLPGSPLAIPEDGFLRLKQVLVLFPVSASTLWKRVREGEFPAPYSLGYRAVGWDAREVREALQNIKTLERRMQSGTSECARAALAKKRQEQSEQKALEQNQLRDVLAHVDSLEQKAQTSESGGDHA